MGKVSPKRNRRGNGLKAVPFDGWLEKQLKNKRFAAHYLTESFQDGTQDEFLLAVHDVVKTHGGVKSFAEKTGVSRQHLHKIFAGKASPTLPTLRMLLNALGFTIDVVPLKEAA